MAAVSKPAVCRRLFAEEDGDEEPREVGENRANRLIEDLNRQEIDQFMSRYNFDPRTETALAGNYLWYRRGRDGSWEQMPVPGEAPGTDPEIPAEVGDPAPDGDRPL